MHESFELIYPEILNINNKNHSGLINLISFNSLYNKFFNCESVKIHKKRPLVFRGL